MTTPSITTHSELRALALAFKTSREAFMALPEEERRAPGVPEFWRHYRAFADAAGYDTVLSLLDQIAAQQAEIETLLHTPKPVDPDLAAINADLEAQIATYREALEKIRDGYQVNHTSKWCCRTSHQALSNPADRGTDND